MDFTGKAVPTGQGARHKPLISNLFVKSGK
jgi:hypothetical protein